MKPFDEASRCAKCGATSASVQWCRQQIGGQTYTASTATLPTPITREWLHRQCRRCKFFWDERCLDDTGGGG